MDEANRVQPIILLVEEDDETRPILRRKLQKDGYRLLLAVDEADALDRLDGGQARPDLILINLIGKTPGEVLQIGRRIREHGKYDGQTPLVVMAEKYGADLEGQDINVGSNDWITYPEDAEQLHRLLARLTTHAR
ncbi:MAG TPA: response regulator [Pyrinomonadaceae bacterium]